MMAGPEQVRAHDNDIAKPLSVRDTHGFIFRPVKTATRLHLTSERDQREYFTVLIRPRTTINFAQNSYHLITPILLSPLLLRSINYGQFKIIIYCSAARCQLDRRSKRRSRAERLQLQIGIYYTTFKRVDKLVNAKTVHSPDEMHYAYGSLASRGLWIILVAI